MTPHGRATCHDTFAYFRWFFQKGPRGQMRSVRNAANTDMEDKSSPPRVSKTKKTRLPEMVSKGLTHFALEKSGLQLPTEATSRRVHLTAQPPGRINQLSRNRREVSIGKGPPQQPAKSFVSMPIFPELLGSTSSGDLLGMMLWPSSRI